MPKKQELLNYLQELHKDSIDLHRGSREEAREAYEYYRGNQLPDDVVWELKQRGQPISWENIYQEIDLKIEGLMLLGKQEVKALPRKVISREIVQVINDTLKSFRDSTEWNTYKKLSNRDLRLAGVSSVEVKLKIVPNELDYLGRSIKELEYIRRPALQLLLDPYSKKPDYSDSRFHTFHELIHKSQIDRLIHKKSKKERCSNDEMIRVYRTWYRDEDWNIRFALWSDDEILQDMASPFTRLDRFPVATRKIFEGMPFKEWYGIYRSIKPLQDKVNFIMLRVSNMLGSKKIIIESNAVEDIDEFIDEYNRDNSVSIVRPDALKNKRFADLNTTNDIHALMSLAKYALEKAKTIIGVNDELLGLATTRLSGDAMEHRKEAGLAGLQNILDVSGELDKDITEISIPILQEHFTAEQLITIRDDFTNEPKEIKLNAYHRDKTGRLIYEGATGERIPKQDSIIDTGRFTLFLVRSAINRGATGERNRGWSEIMKVLQVTRPDAVPAILPSMLRDIESPVAEEVQGILQKMDETAQQQNQNNEVQMQQLQLQLKQALAKVAELESKANLNNAKADEIASNLNKKDIK